MSQYNKILQAFNKFGYNETSSFTQHQMNKALDKINGSTFDRQVTQELWDHTTKDRDQVQLRDFIQSIIQAQNLLREHIQAAEQKLQYQSNPQDKQQLQADLLSYANDHKVLTQPFNLPNIPQSRIISQSKADLAASSRLPTYQGTGDAGWGRTSQIFAMVPSDREQSWSLKIVFILTAILLCIEIFIMFHKNHFFNLVGYTLIMLIFVQNYFDKVYMRITIVWIAASVLLDFLWLIVHAENWWNPYPQTQHSTLHTGYLRFSYFMVICTMLAKVLVVILTIRYFNNSQTIRKSVTLFSLSFRLDGKSSSNPFTQALVAKHIENQARYDFE